MTLMERNPIVAILGARQVGKTTISYEIESMITTPVHRFDLEDPEYLARLEEPKLALQSAKGLDHLFCTYKPTFITLQEK